MTMSSGLGSWGWGWGWDAGGGPYDAYLVYDTFTDDDNVDLTNHTPDKDTVGDGWVDLSATGEWEVKSNEATYDADSAGKQLVCHIDSGNANIKATVTITHIVSDSGMVIRSIDSSNYFLLTISTTTLTIWNHHGGGWSQVATKGSLTISDNDTIGFSADDDDLLSGYLNDVSQVSGTNATANTETAVGLRENTSGDSATCDDFQVVAL